MSNQLTFDLALPPPTYAREDFVVAPGSREALAWLDRWPDWPAPALCLNGPPGSGKSTMMNILGCLDAPTMGHYYFRGVDVGADGREDDQSKKPDRTRECGEDEERAPPGKAGSKLESDRNAEHRRDAEG